MSLSRTQSSIALVREPASTQTVGNVIYWSEFMEVDDEDTAVLTPSKLSSYLSPRSTTTLPHNYSRCNYSEQRNKTSIEQEDEGEYGFFVDTADSFEPMLYLKQNVSADNFTLPPGHDVSKIIIRTHRFRQWKLQQEGSR